MRRTVYTVNVENIQHAKHQAAGRRRRCASIKFAFARHRAAQHSSVFARHSPRAHIIVIKYRKRMRAPMSRTDLIHIKSFADGAHAVMMGFLLFLLCVAMCMARCVDDGRSHILSPGGA